MTADQVEIYEVEQEPEPEPPYPDEVALVAMQGLLASGKFEDPAVAVGQAWAICVPAFYQQRQYYARVIAPALFGDPKS